MWRYHGFDLLAILKGDQLFWRLPPIADGKFHRRSFDRVRLESVIQFRTLSRGPASRLANVRA